VSVPSRDLELFLGRDSADAEMVFECPSCDAAVRTRCDRLMARLLTLSGVRVHRPPDAAWSDHPAARPQRDATPASVTDEVAAFRALLATDGWFDRLHTDPPGPVETA
jgi:hypothetical protein